MLPFVRRSLSGVPWVLALGVVLALAAAMLLLGLGRPGLWDPQERQLADRVAPPAALSIGGAGAFGTQTIGAPATTTLTVTNTGRQSTTPMAIVLTGTQLSILTGADGDCVTGVTVLAAAGSCNVRVQYAPTGGAVTGKVTVSATVGGSRSISLSGNGQTPAERAANATPTDAPTRCLRAIWSNAPDWRATCASARSTEPACIRTQPEDAVARTLTADAMVRGRDAAGDDDAGRRLPFALMGLVTVLAAAGIAMRFAGGRAGLLAGLVLLSMPLLVLQSRMLTTDIGTACGATLLVYGFVALARLGTRSGPAIDLRAASGAAARPTSAGLAIAAVDLAVAIAALVAGRFLGFRGGGMLLGVVVPVGAFAAAGGLGVASVQAAWRRQPVLRTLPVLFATVVAFALLFVLVHQLYELRDINHLVDPDDPSPAARGPARALFGHAVLAEGCWSSALGGVWNANDDIRMVFDSTFEQIAYGTFPWGVLAPIAMIALLRDGDRDARSAGGLTLAWAGLAWIATEVFQRKVGFSIYAGFPALAIAIGIWLDRVLARRASGDAEAMPIGMRLVALFFLLGVLTFGLDIRAFPDRMTSLLIGGEQLAYPKASRLLFTATKNWPVMLGMPAALPFAISLIAWRDRGHPWARRLHAACAWAFGIAMAMTIALAGFWAFAWQTRLADNLSSKALFETYRSLRKSGDRLVTMGDLGHAPHFYADATPELVQSREQVVTSLKAPERVFAFAPQAELCTLHREMAGTRYYVIDDRNVRSLLLSNKLDGTTDKNPLAVAIPHDPPQDIPQKPKGRVVWDNKIELLGWNIPTRMYRGQKVTVTLYYKILQPVNGAWQVLMHFDGPLRFNGDHKPINDRCPTSTWQAGDYIVDTHTFTAGGGAAPSARYVLNIGFFTGSNPNFRNMPLSEAPADLRDEHNRVQIMSVALE